MRDYITLRSASVLSGLSPRLIHEFCRTGVIHEFCRTGVIRARTVRGRWCVHRGDFTAWMTRGR